MKLSIPLGVEILRKIIGTSQCFHLCKQPGNCYFKGWGRGGTSSSDQQERENLLVCSKAESSNTEQCLCPEARCQ